MKRYFAGLGIGQRLTIAIISFSSVLMLVITAGQLLYEYRGLQTDLETDLDNINIYAGTIANSVWNFDDEQIRLTLEGLRNLPNVEAVSVVSSEIDKTWRVGEARSRNTLTRSYELTLQHDGQRQLIGHLRVVASVDAMQRKIVNLALGILIANGIKSFCVAFFIIFLFRQMVSRRLDLLAAKVRQIGSVLPPNLLTGKVADHALALVGDELDNVEWVLNTTSTELQRVLNMLQEREQDLQQHRRELQDRVDRRTRELNDSLRQMAESKQRLEQFIDSAPDAVLLSNAQGRIVLANHMAEQMLGYTRDELLDLTIEALVPERVRTEHPRMRAHYFTHASSRAMGEGLNLSACRKDGREIPVSISLNALESGADRYVISAIRDISAQRWHEEALRAAQVETERINRQLVESNAEIEAFAYSVAHDLRTPLRSMDGFSNILMKNYADQLDATGQDYFNRIRAASQRMGQMIDDILQLSRVSRETLKYQPVDLSAIANDVIRHLREAEPDRQVEVVIAPGLSVQGDAAMLRVALDNLLGNAWKYTGKTEQPRIEFGCEQYDGTTEYFVRDNGAGFDPDHAGKLFSAFQRLHRANEFPGNGIGLATVKRVIRKHGGDIRAEAAPNRGATFFFTLGDTAGIATDEATNA